MDLPPTQNYTRLPSIVIHYLDEFLLVIEKPAGVLSIPGGFSPDVPHIQMLLPADLGRVWMVHRLDRDTSGVMLLARNAEVHRALNMMFDAREIHKTYQAIIHASPEWDTITCAEPLLVNADRAHRTRVSPHGKPAHTDFQVLERFGRKATLILAKPRTGLTHQIRAHLSYLGHPIIHDSLYASREKQASLSLDSPFTSSRMALHAAEISFIHPVTHTDITIFSPLPADMSALIAYLRDSI